MQADGKILVAGTFTTLGGGGTGTTTCNRIGRLGTDGSLDTSFNPGANGGSYTLVVQSDGKILVGGVSRRSAAAAQARRPAITSAGSTPTARSS